MKTAPFALARLSAAAALSLVLLAGCQTAPTQPAAAPAPAAPAVAPAAALTGLTLEALGAFEGGAEGASEITAYDPFSRRLFVVNAATKSIDVLDLRDPRAPQRIGNIPVAAFGDSPNSVAVHSGLVAIAVQAAPKTNPGAVVFVEAATLRVLAHVAVGALPDMLTFTPDGLRVLVANEGEPNSYGQADSVDPEGSVSIITVNRGRTPTVATADFRAFIGQEAALRAQGVRIFGPGANAAQDLEPEFIAVAPDGRSAFVTLQENNAVATVDIASARVTAVRPLGSKDHSLARNALDLSNEDGTPNSNDGTPAIRIAPFRVRGLYQPDAIAAFAVGGRTLLVTANEGDARDWPGFNEEVRVRAHCAQGLDPAAFPDAANQLMDSNLGRLLITSTPNAGQTGRNAAGQCTELFSFGARSFSIWDASNLQQVYDSGDEFEQRTRALPNVVFNASHNNNTLDARSPSKGPEPESVVVAQFGMRFFAFIGLERVGGVMVYEVTNPAEARFVTYFNGTRNAATGDRGPEGLTFIPAVQSPNGRPLLVVANEVSGTTRVLQINLGF
ncbi:MAG: choice-of-anchor I family protein [Serpentinimonas sp.]|nr:choice-of-anchor I family protein [Serpentinimonas sp.]